MTRAPRFAAIAWDPSVLPLSATTISPSIPASSSARRAFRMQVASVSDSLRHGMTTDTSGIMVSADSVAASCGAALIDISYQTSLARGHARPQSERRARQREVAADYFQID